MTPCKPWIGLLLCGLLWSQESWAQSGTGLLLPTPGAMGTQLGATGDAAVARPNWTAQEREALIAAWDHTSGNEAYVLRLAHFSDADAARRAGVLKWVDAKRIGAQELRLLRANGGLVDVPVALRVAAANLVEAGERSPVVRWRDGAGREQWSLLELVSRAKLQPPRDALDFERQAQRWVAEGLLPPPAELLADATHRARAAHWRVRSVADLAAVAPELSPSVRFGNLGTPLLQAVLRNDMELARALLARGADANACGVVGCALHLAFKKDDPARTAAWLELLLGAGARPDQFDAAFMGALSTAMQPAAFYGARAVLERLLKAGADPNGQPGVKVTPLEGALAGGRREVAEWLIQQGASVLPLPDRSRANFFGHGNAWLASSEHPMLRAWITQAMFDAAHRDPRWAYDAHIEQDGKRWPLPDGASVTLRAAPFKLVARLAHEKSGGLTVATSFAPGFAAEVKAGERRNGAVRTMMSSALAPVPEPGSYELLAYEAMPAMARDSDVWGGHMVLTTDANLRADFHEQRRERGEYVREVRAIAPMPEKGAPPPALPLAALKGRELTVVLGTALVLDPMEWAPLVNLRTVTLRFQ